MGKLMQQTTSRTFPPLIQHLVMILLPSVSHLEHLKNCGKNTRKSAGTDAKFASRKGLRMLPFLWMMLFTLERLAGPPMGNLIKISYIT